MSASTPVPVRADNSMTPAIWACAGVLGLTLLLGNSGVSGTAPANAAAFDQPGTTMQPEGPFNSADQRKRMIEQLTMLNERMARLEAKLDKGINVKVIEMPASAKPKD